MGNNEVTRLAARGGQLPQLTSDIDQCTIWSDIDLIGPFNPGAWFLRGFLLQIKVYPDQTAPQELSDQGILNFQTTAHCVARPECVKLMIEMRVSHLNQHCPVLVMHLNILCTYSIP